MRAGSWFRPPRRAIEFTLNTMAAPISASNIQPHSRLSSLEATDPKLLEQVRWREYLKEFYENVLGESCGTANPKETKKRASSGQWEPPSNSQQFAPPSPRRYDEATTRNRRTRARATRSSSTISWPRSRNPGQRPARGSRAERFLGQETSGSSSEGFHFDPPTSTNMAPTARRRRARTTARIYVSRPVELRRRPRTERLFRLPVPRADEQRRLQAQRLSARNSPTRATHRACTHPAARTRVQYGQDKSSRSSSC